MQGTQKKSKDILSLKTPIPIWIADSISQSSPNSSHEVLLKLAEDDLFHLLDVVFPKRTSASSINRVYERLIPAIKNN